MTTLEQKILDQWDFADFRAHDLVYEFEFKIGEPTITARAKYFTTGMHIMHNTSSVSLELALQQTISDVDVYQRFNFNRHVSLLHDFDDIDEPAELLNRGGKLQSLFYHDSDIDKSVRMSAELGFKHNFWYCTFTSQNAVTGESGPQNSIVEALESAIDDGMRYFANAAAKDEGVTA